MKKIINWLHSLSIYTKLAVLIFAMISFFASIIIYLAINTSKTQTEEIAHEMINSNILSNKDFIASAILAHDNWALFKFLKSFSKNSIIANAGIVDENFIVLADTDTKKHRIGTILNDLKNHTVIPFKKDGVLLGYFILDIEKQSIKKLLEKSFFNNFLIMVFAAVLSLLIAVYFMRNLLNRLDILKENAKAISQKNWEDIKEIQSRENDEITELVNSTTLLMREVQTSVEKEEELKNFYQQTLASVDIFIVICDKDLNIIYQNHHPLSKILLEDGGFKNEYIKKLINCYKDSSCKFCKQKISDKFGEDLALYYQIRKVKESLVISFSDITQLSRLEENEKILHSLKTLGEISSLFAHEVKNLLQPLKLLLQDENEIDKEDLYIVNNTLDRINAQVIDFLSLGKPIDKKNIKAINAKNFFEELLEIIRPKLKENNITLRYDIDEDLKVYMSKNSLEMILVNLINNSVEALQKDGEIEISWHSDDKDMSVLKIVDSGSGIPKQMREKIFKPFFTTKSNGSGLGLFTIYKIVYLSGGQISLLESDKTTFVIKLPLEGQHETLMPQK